MFDAVGVHSRTNGVVQDITDHKRILKELIDNQRNAEAASLAKSNFLSTMSHEIRTPLNGVLGLAQLLTTTDLTTDQRKKVDTILSSGQTLLAIISDVLDMSRIEAGGVELEEKAFNLRGLVSTIATPFQSLADDKGLTLKVIDKFDSGIVVKGDPVRLRQILWNLLSNAIKFTRDGSVTLTIQKVGLTDGGSAWVKDHVIQFSVEDTGPGIAADRIDVIFDAFIQEDNSITRKHGGTGLGLSIVKQLTELMGGTIKAESQFGHGTQFVVCVPFAVATTDEADALSLDDDGQQARRVSPLNVLVAEDNEVNAEIARAFLQKAGHNVTHVENGKQAVLMAKEGWVDFIFMDIHMPEMNGIDATRWIRLTDTGEGLPIVGLTVEAFTERHAQFITAGMNGVLTKPFTEQQLADTLAQFRSDRNNLDNDVPDPFASPHVTEGSAKISPTQPSVIIADNPQDANPDDHGMPIGDETRLNAFCDQIGPEIVSSLLGKAQVTLQIHVDKLHQGIVDVDPTAIFEAAHSIKGTSGSMFAIRISELARAIEEQSADVAAVRDLMPEFEDTAKSTKKWWLDHQT